MTHDEKKKKRGTTPSAESAIEDPAVQVLCKANGISDEQLLHRASEVRKLEMFMYVQRNMSYPHIMGMEHFCNLRELQLFQQGIKVIEGLETCANLEELWLNENEISKIEGLDACLNLRKLFLYSNQISKIENLDSLTKLEVLWLGENEITEIEGLAALSNLKDLSLASNKIDSIGPALDPNGRLETLNLSDNLIGCFKEIPNLARLPELKTLLLMDPNHGDNPVCNLCNYQTYVLFHLSTLTSLDGIPLMSETKQIAEATYLKKKMYYNMRIKTLKRNATNIIKKATEAKQAKVSQVNLNMNVLLRQKKDIERELAERTHLPEADDEFRDKAMEDQLRTKYQVLDAGIRQKSTEVEKAEEFLDRFKTRAFDISEESINRLVLELETGGNMRLEDGKTSEVWYTSCMDLVRSRFNEADFLGYGITDIKIVRVTRIHNRFLRNRFEERLDTLVDTTDPSYKRHLEYLFFGEPPELEGEISHVIEDGFRPCDEYLETGGHGAICLSNSVALSDLPRVRDRLKSKPKGSTVDGDIDAVPGRLLITKVYLGKVTTFNESERVRSSAFSGYNAVYSAKSDDAKQRTWCVFDHALVLPEYIVEFEYLSGPSDPTTEPTVAKLLQDAGVSVSPQELERLESGPLHSSLVKFLKASNVSTAADPYDDICTAALNMPPLIPQRPKVFLISDDLIQKVCRTPDLSHITYLNLHSNNIRKIEGLSALENLKSLVLSFNEIQKIEGLQSLRNLEQLELGFNLIKRVEGLKGLDNLRVLELNNNLVYRLEDINVLKKCVPNLEELNLRNCAVCEVKSYQGVVLRRLTSLQVLDGRVITVADRNNASEGAVSITAELIRDNAFAKRRSGWNAQLMKPPVSGRDALDTERTTGSSSRSQSRRSGRETADSTASANGDDDTRSVVSGYSTTRARRDGRMKRGGLRPIACDPTLKDSDSWWSKVEELDLDHLRLRKISMLDKLQKIRKITLNDNEISRLEGLENCTFLEELSLEENRIMKIENLDNLTFMKKLDLGKNKISRIEGLLNLSHLTQLSIEDNELSSLAGLSHLSNLMELYAGNNRISDLREILQLKELPKLIILDLNGNALCTDPEYRLYSVYHLRKLKVLDGLGIESSEQSAAREKYSGKLTHEFLVDKIGHGFFEHVRELDISGCRIREVGQCLSPESFTNLREVNLDNNNMSSLSGLSQLRNLVVLRLNHNRISTIGDGPDDGFSELVNLEVLQLGYNQIAHIPMLNLKNLVELKVLFLQGNDIQKVEGLENLTQLRELVLDKNKVRFLSEYSFANLVNLRELRLEENGLRSLLYLNSLPKLQSLFLTCNRIMEMPELERLCGMNCLVELSLQNNPVSRKQLYRPSMLRYLPSLRILDGREISYEERERVEVLFAAADRRESPVPPGYLPVTISNAPTAKVPLKLTAMSFESLSGIGRDSGQPSYPPTVMMGPPPVQGGHFPSHVHPLAAAQHPHAHMAIPAGYGQRDDWHPYTGSTEDFFLPSTKARRNMMGGERSPVHAQARVGGPQGASAPMGAGSGSDREGDDGGRKQRTGRGPISQGGSLPPQGRRGSSPANRLPPSASPRVQAPRTYKAR